MKQYGHFILMYLFNLMLLSGYVPMEFGFGITYPIPKCVDNRKNVTTDDFRGITISSLISKMFEKCIVDRFGDYLTSSDHQFGFKKKIGCSHAIFCLKSVVNYYIFNGSTVNACALDLSTAFGKVNCSVLLLKLMDKKMPSNIILLFSVWFNNSFTNVFWNGSLSKQIKICAGVRQGGVLSPSFFPYL